PARAFARTLVERRGLEEEGAPPFDLARHRPYVPRHAVYERHGDDVVVYGRAAAVTVPRAARPLARADGTRPLGELAPRSRWPALLRLCEADLAALKLLPPGQGIPSWAESTMPWPAVDPHAWSAGMPLRSTGAAAPDPGDLAAYHDHITDAAAQFDDTETTLSHLFREPHRALGGATFGARLAEALVRRGVRVP